MTRISSASACTYRAPAPSPEPRRARMSFANGSFSHWRLVIAAIYGARLTTLPIRGEETRRAEVATEILRTGDWIVPREQGAPFLSRPPLGSYPIALLEMLWGTGSLLAVRLPSVVATWLMTLIVYGYSRRFLEPLGALAAGFAFATTGMVLQLGRLAETDALFTLFVGGSLLLWHWGYSSQWRRPWPWVAGYLFAALGALTKGPQAPVYFVGSIALYLAWRREWRQLCQLVARGWNCRLHRCDRRLADPLLAGNGLGIGAGDLVFGRRSAIRRHWLGPCGVASAGLSRRGPDLRASLVAVIVRLFVSFVPRTDWRGPAVGDVSRDDADRRVSDLLARARGEGTLLHAAVSLPRPADRLGYPAGFGGRRLAGDADRLGPLPGRRLGRDSFRRAGRGWGKLDRRTASAGIVATWLVRGPVLDAGGGGVRGLVAAGIERIVGAGLLVGARAGRVRRD